MRFISGNRTNKPGQKKGLAGVLYKLSLTGKKPPELTPEEKYQKMFDDKMAKIMDDLAMGKKKSFVLPGTRPEEKTKTSKSFQATMEMLARKKALAALAKQKKKEKEKDRKKYFAKEAQKTKALLELQKKEQLIKQQQTDYTQQQQREYELQQQQELERQQQLQQQQSASGSYFFGTTPDDKKDSWW